eukprot:CAMPEP_0182825946 /NCGR_PEP_ID=MMETSP0006_2-20121128/16112_1 /TAXON_ID=97485 /ORGANISM="Prymnesium parvum, Strain Texoma1" /LENGTH=80 /DNA_ID=CAMNT_0024953079 /DNA_START=304 /DNA_END=547 /DNA_ORIENTATION=-
MSDTRHASSAQVAPSERLLIQPEPRDDQNYDGHYGEQPAEHMQIMLRRDHGGNIERPAAPKKLTRASAQPTRAQEMALRW